MANLKFTDRLRIEELLQMSGGYVLDLSNVSFREFVMDAVGIDIDDPRFKSRGGSRAKRLRAFWDIESDSVVGKLLDHLIEYARTMREPPSSALVEHCVSIAERLKGKQRGTGKTPSSPDQKAMESVLADLYTLQSEQNRQKAGLRLESILTALFRLHNLLTRGSFRVVGEQIDGAFELDSESYLMEAKWEREPLPEAPLLIFKGKIEGKSAFSRGVFIAMNGLSHDAKEAITRGKTPCFFVIDGYDISRVLAGDMNFIEFLRERRRVLAEEGAVAITFPELKKRMAFRQ